MTPVTWVVLGALAMIYAGIFAAFSVHSRRLRVERPRYCCGCGAPLTTDHICTE